MEKDRTEVKIKYAHNREGKLVSISDVPSGLECGCTCVACGEALVAKKGDIKQHHFAHVSGVECDGYLEALLHIWAREILDENKSLMFPEYKDKYGDSLAGLLLPSQTESLKAHKVEFKEIRCPKSDNKVHIDQPDVIGVLKDGTEFWIEFWVTHKSTPEKIQYLKDNGINCLEIEIPETINSKKALQGYLLGSASSDLRVFLNYPYADELVEKAKLELQAEMKEAYPLCNLVKKSECAGTGPKSFAKVVFDKIKEGFKFKIFMWAWETTYEDFIDGYAKIQWTKVGKKPYIQDRHGEKHYIYPYDPSRKTYLNDKTYAFFKSLETLSILIKYKDSRDPDNSCLKCISQTHEFTYHSEPMCLCNKINREKTEDGILIDKEIAAYAEFEEFAKARWERIKKWREANGIVVPQKATYEPKKPLTPEERSSIAEKYKDYPDEYEALSTKKYKESTDLDELIRSLSRKENDPKESESN